MKKIIIGITAPPSVDLIVGQLNYLKNCGFDVLLLAPDDERVRLYCKNEGVNLLPVRISRNISVFNDIKTLFSLIRIFSNEKPDIVNLGTPKISLLGMVAATIARVPFRVYTCRGFRFEHERGVFKKFLIFLEKITAGCAHRVFCISKSVNDLGIRLRIFNEHKSRLIHKGSSNGVDMTLFNPDAISFEAKEDLSVRLNISGCFVYGFVGRLVDRKGINEMFHAFSEAYEIDKDIRLLVVGRPFWDQIEDKQVIHSLEEHPGVIMVGFQPLEQVPCYFSLMDVFLLPAHWEGFGNVLIQAAAMGVAIVATEVTGVKDAVLNNFNGVLIEPANHQALLSAMLEIKKNSSLRKKMASNGMIWSKNFEPTLIWQGYVRLYNEAP